MHKVVKNNYDNFLQNWHDSFWRVPYPINQISESYVLNYQNLLLIRFVLMCYLVTFFVWQTVLLPNVAMIIMYMTLWGDFFTMLYFILTVIEMISYKVNGNQTFFQGLWKTCHFLFELAWTYEFTIVLVFWVVLWPRANFTGLDLLMNCQLHGGFFATLIIDICINNIEFYVNHFVYILCSALVYMGVNMVYSLNWSPVYPGITWLNYGSYLTLIGAIILFLIWFSVGFFFFSRIKKIRINRKMVQSDSLLNKSQDHIIY